MRGVREYLGSQRISAGSQRISAEWRDYEGVREYQGIREYDRSQGI